MAAVEHELLRTLHRMHRQRADLNSRIERGPKQLNAKQKQVAEIEQQLADLRTAQKKTQVLANEKQLLLKQREEKILDFRGKLNAAKSNEEFQAFKNQIAADEQANEVLSDEIFEQLEKIDDIVAQIDQAKQQLEATQKELAAVQTKVETEEQGLRAELDRVTGELKEAESRLPIEIRPDYLRIASSRGEEALAELEGEFCGGCYQKITRMQHSDLAAKKAVFCKSCGAIIYLPENTRV